MKLITRDTDYALRAVCFMARHSDKRVAVAELVRELKVPGPFLRKLLQILHRKRILRAYKGQGGGFSLAVRADKLFLVRVMEIFQGQLRLNECFLKKVTCPHTRLCPLRKKINNIEKYVLRELKSITIASLLR